MAPDTPINERVAALEPQLVNLQDAVEDLQEFRTTMVTQISELRADLKILTWRVALITGALLLIGNKFLDWATTQLNRL